MNHTQSFLGILLSVVGFSFSASAAAPDKEFACYAAMNKPSRTPRLVMDDKLAIHPVDARSFYAITKGSVKLCKVPKGASLAPEADPKVGPWLVKLTADKTPFHFQYPESVEHTDLKGAPPFKTPDCKDVPKQSRDKIVAAYLEDRISDTRQACPSEGPKFKECLGNFVIRLKACEGVSVISDYVFEIGRSARVHAKPEGASADAQEGTQ